MFPRPSKTLIPVVKDFERFLRQPRKLKAEEAAGFKTLTQHSNCSPDLNTIENYWDLLQDRLLLTAPVEIESRAAFIKRLRRTVNWMNDNARQHARGFCRKASSRSDQTSWCALQLLVGATTTDKAPRLIKEFSALAK